MIRMSADFSVICVSIAALALGACSDSGFRVEQPREVNREVAATVNGEAIYTSDVELEAVARGLVISGAALKVEDEAYKQVLDQLIDQKLMAQEALRRDLDRDPAGVRRLEMARERILGNLLVESVVASQVTDEMIDKMYSEQVRLQQVNDQVSVAHIVTETEEEAEKVWLRIQAGETFESLVFNNSKDSATRMENGDLGYVAPNNLPEPYPVMIANTAVGEVSAPFQAPEGWVILKVKDRRTEPPKTREEMRPEIATFLTLSEVSRVLRRLRTEAVIEQGTGKNYSPASDPAVPGNPLTGDEL
ncbi:peptidylprolyl isomerase [Hyphomonas sp. WL0036]|uniref:peptidylprolyl isomerase n=1 Tax=Hyphomonas sediminis TaxID=2866160 RepID=UPI001C826549|nr:peptidylprolyl isomerase [Hyphomonas sediminis]MBY9066388.1 peptidylprolyl isomerase [Hyphomonas sediminis]